MARVRSHDWKASSLGAPETWPAAARVHAQSVLDNPFPMVFLLGADHVVAAYNDAYLRLLGAKPEALGRPVAAVWSELEDEIAPLLDRALAGEACRFENARFSLHRGPEPEDAHFDYAFSPARDEEGRIVGVLVVAVEITERMRADAALAEVRTEEARQRLFLETLLDAAEARIAVLQGPELRFTLVNPAYQGLRPDTPMLGRGYEEIFPEAREAAALLRRVLATGEREIRTGYHAPIPGEPDARWDHQITRLPASGEPGSLLVLTWDATAHWRAQRDLRRSEARFRSFADGLPLLVWVHDAAGGHDFVNETFRRFFGFSPAERSDIDWRDVVHPDDYDAYVETFLARFAAREPFRAQARVRRADGAWRWIESWGEPRFSEDGAFERYIGASADATERVEAERHRDLLMAELDHRVKNTLAVVQGIAQHTFRNGVVGEPALEAFKGRLRALAGAHDLLTRESWAQADLAAVAAKALAFGGARERVRIDGPPVRVTPKQAVTMGMALHELATNALKHGALSRPRGRVCVVWRVSSGHDCRRLVLEWRETDGPPAAPPARRGFGLRMIERALAADLGGTVTLDFAREGLVCRLDAPLPTEARRQAAPALDA
ncbi:PAS domain-containing protein [Salinarimonas sp.]|uniref:PAS domain-containing protein n=1 Tax=Salinarimonas sp. TaxID=2766526 RepID=UPI0032D90033